MSTLADLLRAQADAPTDSSPDAKLQADNDTPLEASSMWGSRHNGVRDSEDLQRILGLPRKDTVLWGPNDPRIMEMTEELRRPGSTATLRPIQAQALWEAREASSLLGLIGVGQGKTLISLLLPTIWNSRKAVIFVPASLIPKVRHDYEVLLKDWRINRLEGSDVVWSSPPQPGVIYAVSYSALSTKSGADLLERIKPNALIGDEAHAFAGLQRSSRRDRFRRYVRAASKDSVREDDRLKHLGLLTGTLITRSIKPACTLGAMLFGVKSPFPIDYHETEAWSYALDPSPDPAPPGELMQLCAEGETAREGFQRRITSSLGVVATSADIVEAGLEFHRREVDVPQSVKDALVELRKSWKTPTGRTFDLALEFSRYARQLSTGLELYFTFPRGEPQDVIDYWFQVRAAWNKEVNDFLNHRSKPGMDSVALLEEAAADGRWKSQFYEEWKAVESKVEPVTEVHWVSDFLIKDATDWGKKPGIIWTVNVAFAKRLSEESGFPYFGDGMGAELIAESKRSKARTIIASMDAFNLGFDLQLWNRMLFTYTSSNPKRWEQALARSHRTGQLNDVVEAHYYAHTRENQKAIVAAVENAKAVRELTRQSQKLLDGTFVDSDWNSRNTADQG